MASSAQRRPFGLAFFASAFVVFWLMIAAGPFVWTVWGSFKVESDFFSKADWRYAVYGVRSRRVSGGTRQTR